MSTYKSFTEIPLWKEAVDFAAEVYRFCQNGDLRTDYRMKDQLRAAASSISNNIAEGYEYSNNRIFVRFLLYSKGSAAEVYNQFLILFKAGIINEKDFTYFSNKASLLGKKIGGYIQYLRSTIR